MLTQESHRSTFHEIVEGAIVVDDVVTGLHATMVAYYKTESH